eukprot:gene3451-6857_t
MADANQNNAAFFRVTHKGGLKVRKNPSLSAETTGLIIEFGRVIACNQCVQDGPAWFVYVVDVGGWAVAQSGDLKAMERIEGPKRVQGEWYYEVVHPNGMRFASLPEITAERHEHIHPKGNVLKGIEKITEPASPLTVVRLQNDYGWLFESTITGEVLDRLDDDVVLISHGTIHPAASPKVAPFELNLESNDYFQRQVGAARLPSRQASSSSIHSDYSSSYKDDKVHTPSENSFEEDDGQPYQTLQQMNNNKKDYSSTYNSNNNSNSNTPPPYNPLQQHMNSSLSHQGSLQAQQQQHSQHHLSRGNDLPPAQMVANSNSFWKDTASVTSGGSTSSLYSNDREKSQRDRYSRGAPMMSQGMGQGLGPGSGLPQGMGQGFGSGSGLSQGMGQGFGSGSGLSQGMGPGSGLSSQGMGQVGGQGISQGGYFQGQQQYSGKPAMHQSQMGMSASGGYSSQMSSGMGMGSGQGQSPSLRPKYGQPQDMNRGGGGNSYMLNDSPAPLWSTGGGGGGGGGSMLGGGVGGVQGGIGRGGIQGQGYGQGQGQSHGGQTKSPSPSFDNYSMMPSHATNSYASSSSRAVPQSQSQSIQQQQMNTGFIPMNPSSSSSSSSVMNMNMMPNPSSMAMSSMTSTSSGAVLGRVGGRPQVAPAVPPLTIVFNLPPLEQRVSREYWAHVTSTRPLQVIMFSGLDETPTPGIILAPGSVVRCSQICNVQLEGENELEEVTEVQKDINGYITTNGSSSAFENHHEIKNRIDIEQIIDDTVQVSIQGNGEDINETNDDNKDNNKNDNDNNNTNTNGINNENENIIANDSIQIKDDNTAIESIKEENNHNDNQFLSVEEKDMEELERIDDVIEVHENDSVLALALVTKPLLKGIWKQAFKLKEGGWVLSESKEGISLIHQLEEVACEEWYRIVYKGGVTLRSKPCLTDRLDVALPLGAWVRISQRVTVRLPNQEYNPETCTTFLKIEGCVGARPSVEEGWVFDRAAGHLAAQITKEPTVIRGSDLLVIVLYPGGIKLRSTPSLEGAIVGAVAKAFETQSVDGIVKSHDGIESYALLPGGAWLPCRGPGGIEVARRISERSMVSAGMFEVHIRIMGMDQEQQQMLLSKLFYHTPCLDEPPCAVPPGPYTKTVSSIMFVCNYSVRYPTSGIHFLRIQLGVVVDPTSYWIKDVGDGLIAIKSMAYAAGNPI